MSTPAPEADGDGPLVLDASVILEGMPLPRGRKCMIPAAVRDEVAKGAPARALEGMLAAGLEVRDPSPGHVEDVVEAARASGDYDRLSPADVDCVALALEAEATLLTDDYSMQNVAKALGVRWRGVMQRGIRESRTWELRCRGCGRRFGRAGEKLGVGDDCPVCGSPLRQVPRK